MDIKFYIYRREAENDMQVVSCTPDEVLVEIVQGGNSLGKLLLHCADEFVANLVLLIARKQIGNLKNSL